MGFRQFPWRRLFFHGVSILLLASLLLGSLPFLQSNRLSILGGEVGFQLSLYLKNLMGGLGFYLLWAFLLICFLAMSHIIAAVPYTPRNIHKTPTAGLADAPMDAAGTTADETGSSAEAVEPTDMVTGPSATDAKGPEAADTGTRPCPPAHPVHPYVPAELQRPEGITLEVYRRPNEPEQSPRTETSPWPAAPVAPDQARSGQSAPAPETVAATAGLAGMVPMPASAAAAGTIAIQDIPLASQTISTSLNEAFAAAPAASPADSAAALPTDGNGPDGPTLRIDDIPLAGGAAAAERSPQAPVPPAEEAADADELGFTVERPAVEEGIAPQTTTSPTRIGLDTPYDPRLDLRDYRFPIIDLLEDFGVQDVQVLDE
ncbi:MAG: hypothetical protein K2H70_04760, partial [Bacteroidales bacterium]|nr:hypothetical protein [Bacteroidales bacterium]